MLGPTVPDLTWPEAVSMLSFLIANAAVAVLLLWLIEYPWGESKAGEASDVQSDVVSSAHAEQKG